MSLYRKSCLWLHVAGFLVMVAMFNDSVGFFGFVFISENNAADYSFFMSHLMSVLMGTFNIFLLPWMVIYLYVLSFVKSTEFASDYHYIVWTVHWLAMWSGSFFQWAYLFPWIIDKTEQKIEKEIVFENRTIAREVLLERLRGLGFEMEENDDRLSTYPWEKILNFGGGIFLFKRIDLLVGGNVIVLKQTFNRWVLLVVFIASIALYFLMFPLEPSGEAFVGTVFQPIIFALIISIVFVPYAFLFRRELFSKIQMLDKEKQIEEENNR